MVKRLPIVKIGEGRYFKDERLQEFRNVKNPSDAITFTDYKHATALIKLVKKSKGKLSIIEL